MRNVIMLSPHCDDIPLSLGASLLAGEWGADVHVVVIFSVSRYSLPNGWDNEPDVATAPNEKSGGRPSWQATR